METSRLTPNSIIRSASLRLCWSSFTFLFITVVIHIVVSTLHYSFPWLHQLLRFFISPDHHSSDPFIQSSLMFCQPDNSIYSSLCTHHTLVITKLSRLTIVFLCCHAIPLWLVITELSRHDIISLCCHLSFAGSSLLKGWQYNTPYFMIAK